MQTIGSEAARREVAAADPQAELARRASLIRRTEALAAASPRWLGELRREALASALALPPPRADQASWRFTDLSRLDLDAIGTEGVLGEQTRRGPELRGERELLADPTLSSVIPAGVELAGLLVLEEGAVLLRRLDETAARAGVVLGDLASIARDRPELVEGRLGALLGRSDRFAAHGLALHTGGAFLEVPPGVELTRPIQVVQLSRGSRFSRSLVVIGKGARAIWNEVYRSGSGDPLAASLQIPASEVFLDAGASLDWTLWQRASGRARQLAQLGVELQADARLAMLSVAGGGELMRTQLEVALAGSGAQAELLGLYAPRGAERIEHWTCQHHLAPATRSNLHYRGILGDEARSLYHGSIRVAATARRTDAYQANRNLLLSPRACALSNPELEIAQNDVRCTHGATVGPIDPAQLFYLMTRGLSRQEAERLIARGFLASVLERAPWSGLAPEIEESLSPRSEA